MKLSLDQIVVDPSIQCRVATDPDAIAEYAEAMRDGAKFPPLVVFHDGEVYRLADGFNRLGALRELKRKTAEVFVRQGDRDDAEVFAAGANREHGLRMTREAKRNAVAKLLANPKADGWSDREIAAHVGVSHTFVSRLRRPTTGNVATPDTRDSDGQAGNVASHDERKSAKTQDSDSIGIRASNAKRAEPSPVPAPPPAAVPPHPPAPAPAERAAPEPAPAPARPMSLLESTKLHSLQEAQKAYRVFCTAVRAATGNKEPDLAAFKRGERTVDVAVIHAAFEELDRQTNCFANGWLGSDVPAHQKRAS